MSDSLELTYSDVSTHSSKKVPYNPLQSSQEREIFEADGFLRLLPVSLLPWREVGESAAHN